MSSSDDINIVIMHKNLCNARIIHVASDAFLSKVGLGNCFVSQFAHAGPPRSHDMTRKTTTQNTQTVFEHVSGHWATCEMHTVGMQISRCKFLPQRRALFGFAVMSDSSVFVRFSIDFASEKVRSYFSVLFL